MECELKAQRRSAKRSLRQAPDGYDELVGCSPQVRKLFALLRRLESSLASVVIEGESGTGKELVARAIHRNSRVSSGKLVTVNCGAVERSLVRSELFGHRRGAFTGAVESRLGAFEAASGGTLFLDEIGELPLDVQPTLLRALEVGAIVPVGEHEERPVSVRVIAATNRDLAAEVRAGRFREDLYFRLLVIQIKVPPLRERPGDVKVLARRLAEETDIGEVPEPVLDELAARPWPGNVRELRNAIQSYAALGVLPECRSVVNSDLNQVLRSVLDFEQSYAAQKDQLMKQFLRVYVEALLARTAGNQSLASRISGLERSHLNKIVTKLKAGDAAGDARETALGVGR